MRRVDTVTLTPLCSPSRPDTEDCGVVYAPAPLQAAARHLRHVSAVTSLALQPWRALRQRTDMHGLSCIASMPHLRCLRVEDLVMPALPALMDTLACMPQLRELHLDIRDVPFVVRSGYGGAAVVGRRLAVLTALEAVNLTLAYRPLHFRRRTQTMDHSAPLLRELGDKGVEITGEHFRFKGTRDPAAVLGVLRAASPVLDLQRCSVEESGDSSIGGLPPAGAEAALRALLESDSGVDVAVSLTGLVLMRDGMLQLGDAVTVGVSLAMLGSLPGLQGLALAFHQPQEIDLAVAQDLAQRLPGLTRLTQLNFGLSTFGVGTARLLLPRLAPLTALQLLDLMDVCMGPEGAVALSTALPSLGALTRLRLQGNAIGERAGTAVMTALAPAAAAGMLELRLAFTGIGSRGAAALGERLPEMTSLRDLDLCGAGIAGGLKGLQGGLEARTARLPALTKLDLSENSLECSDAVAIAHMLPRLPILSDLHLGGNKIGPVGARALACAIVRMQHLRNVALQFNCIGDAGAKALARTLRRTALRDQGQPCHSYTLSICGIGDAGALAFADAVHRVCAARQSGMGRAEGWHRNSYYVFLNCNEISARVADALHELTERSRRQGLNLNFCATP